MFKKPALPGKENAVAPRPRLGLSSLQHSAKMKVENDIESAGASLKVLSVENSRQKVTSTTAAGVNKPAPCAMVSSQPAHSAARSTHVTKSAPTHAATKVNGPTNTATINSKNGVPRKGPESNVTANATANATNAAEPELLSAKAVELKPETAAENGDAKKTDEAAAQQTEDKAIKKAGSWELSNFDIGRPLGRGMRLI